jgi:Flp pilus assembly protein TadD
VQHFSQAAQIDPDDTEAQSFLVVALAQQGKVDQAVEHLTPELNHNSQFAEVHRELGAAFAQQGKLEQAIASYRRAVSLKPTVALYRFSLGVALQHSQQAEAANAEFREAMERDPRWPLAACQTAWMLATHPDAKLRDGALALQLAQQACEATGKQWPTALDALAAAYAETGRFEEAVRTAREALSLATSARQPELAKQIEQRLNGYERHQPFREGLRKNGC